METLFGWIDCGLTVEERDAVTQRMQSVLPNGMASEPCRLYTEQCGLVVNGRGEVSKHDDDRGLAILVGSARWSESALAELAMRDGAARALAAGYQKYGDRVLRLIKGAFSLAVVDKGTGRALLAVDRMGIFPLAYAQANGAIVFGSTVDCVKAHPWIRTTIDPQSVYNYLYFHMIPAPDTIYTDISKLKPAHCLTFHQGKLETTRYWWPEFSESSDVGIEQFGEQLRVLLHKAVSRCEPDGHTGAFLSGGIDSSTVSGILSEICPPAKTYSIGFQADGYDEIGYARIASRHFGTQQREYYVSPQDVAMIIPDIARTYDEPFGNSSAVAVYYCADMARQDGINTMLAGDGGDELFAGNERYATQGLFELYAKVPTWARQYFIQPFADHFPGGQHVLPVRKLRRYLEQATIPLPARLDTYNFLHMVPATDIFSADFLSSVNERHPITLRETSYEAASGTSVLNRLLRLDWEHTLADNDLRKVNKMCALAGLNVRYPMLDDDLVELSTQVPSSWKLKNHKLRYFFKHALRDFLPKEVLRKQKHGFGLPFGVWLCISKELKQLSLESIQRIKARHFFNSDFLDTLVTRHHANHAAYYGELIWLFMMLELWLGAHGE